MNEIKNETQAFTLVPDIVIYEYNLHAFALSLYTVILSHTYKGKKTAFPSLDRIADLAGMSRSSAKKYLAELENAGLIKVTERRGEDGRRTSNLYTVLDPYEQESPSPQSPHNRGGSREKTGVQSPRNHEEEQGEPEQGTKKKNSSPPEKPADGRENGTPPDDPTPDAVTAPQETDTTPNDEPTVTDSTDAPAEITWQHAVAFYHDWRTEDGALDTNHRLANTYLSFFGGRSKKGEWKDFRFESGDWTEPGMLAGFRLWYKTYQTKQGLPDSAIPTSPQSINSWGLRYLSLSAKNLRAWNEKGAQRLRAEVYGDHDTDAYEAENAVPENYNPYTAQ